MSENRNPVFPRILRALQSNQKYLARLNVGMGPAMVSEVWVLHGTWVTLQQGLARDLEREGVEL